MSDLIKLNLTVDGKALTFETETGRRLLDILRDEAGIKGVREGCGEGECGACSVFMDGRLVNSCCIPAVAAEGCSIVTIEGLSGSREFRIISDAYAEAGAVQCGFCTPGFIMATAALLRTNPAPTDKEIREGLSGNLCRCTGYTMIIDAAHLAAVRLAAERNSGDD